MKSRGMTLISPRSHQTSCPKPLNAVLTACALVLALAMVAPDPAFAQTYSVIYQFAGGPLGANPGGSMVMDRDGNLYGTTFAGGGGTCPNVLGYSGTTGCGTVFKFNPSTRRFTVLYEFTGGTDGAAPLAPLLLAADGTLYGSTAAGGLHSCSGPYGNTGCGVVFHLQPRPTPPRDILENYWLETPIYTFQGAPDGQYPQGDLAMDQSGDLYGSTNIGGEGGGVVFELTSSQGNWSESILHTFVSGPSDGSQPIGGVTLDPAGNVYGTAAGGAYGWGTVYRLLAQPGWPEQLLYSFTDGSDGAGLASDVTLDSTGNLYGSTFSGGSGGGGTAFELSSGTWAFQLLSSFTGSIASGPFLSDLVRDQAGNLYGTTYSDGAYSAGSVFKLTPSMGGGYTYTSLHDFCAGGGSCVDGALPIGTLVMDTSGNLYGTASWGGFNVAACDGPCGVIFKITP